MGLKYFSMCRVQCCSCKSILEYKNKSKTDWGPGRMMVCSCGRVALDPAVTMYRIVGLKRDAAWEDHSEPWEDFNEHIPTTETIAAMEEAIQMRLQHNICKGYTDLENLFSDLKNEE